MKNLRRFWNQNRSKIIITVAVVVFIFAIIQIVNQILKEDHSSENIAGALDKGKPIQSVITGENVSEEKTDENTNIIKEFVQNCNNKEYEKAFLLLTEESKAQFNNDVNSFVNSYCKNVFSTSRTYKLELWLNETNQYTYKIKYYDNNMMATGNINTNQAIEDYITVVTKNKENKLNINNLITKKNIDKSQNINNIEVIINSKEVYADYETYSITIKNNTDKTILISDRQNSKDISLIDKNNVKYSSFIHENSIEELSVDSMQTKNIEIRFNKIYDIYRIIEKIEMSNIILDKELYLQNPNDENIQKVSISIEI